MRLIPRHRHHTGRKVAADRDQPGGDHRRPALPGAAAGGSAAGRRRPARGGADERRRGRGHGAEATARRGEAFAESSPETSRSRTLVWQDPVPTAAAGATMTGMEYMTAIVAGECRRRRSR